jgi:uncharacterized protein YdaU (DUF1376 family)
MPAKLLAEWFWTDRWIGSSGFLLPMEARGVYREMLTQAWRRGAKLPNDHEAIRRAIGATNAEWKRSWPKVSGFWRVDGTDLVNDTQRAVYAETMDLSEKRSAAGRLGNDARWGYRKRIANGIANASPPSPSPSPSPPPVAPLRGACTKRDLEYAARLRARSLGGCPHTPRCSVYRDCLELIASTVKWMAS